MNKETVQKARQSNLPIYLLDKGENLIQTGNRYRHADHESLVFTDNSYFWNSHGEKGNAIDFLMNFYKMDFPTAVKELAGQQKKEMAQTYAVQPFSFDNLAVSQDMRRAFAYLTKTRCIDIAIIEDLIKSKHLFQESETNNNIIFPMYDETHQIVGAETSGTLSERRFKGIKEGSKYGYGYNIGYADKQGYSYALFFESAIDLISFIEIERIKKKTLTGCLLVSMAGLKENIIEHSLKIYGNTSPLQCVLCVDNDTAGLNLLTNITGRNLNPQTHFPDKKYKDWNEQLKSIKTETTII